MSNGFVPRIVAVLTLTSFSATADCASARQRPCVTRTWGPGVDDSLICVTDAGIVETTTTNRVRHVPIPEPVSERLRDELPTEPNALVFGSYRGGHLPIEEYRRAFAKGCKAVGIADLVPHGLRHTTACRWRSVRALMSRSCRGFSDTPQRP
ncbi:Putative integrase (fragment-part1) [Mycobacterium canettii CIPT 140070017]|nr:Putative integrase (fragment-part1) [Mycobacterium canettii CIPT 140070017]